MAERTNAAALKAVEGHTSQGSNPCLSATYLIQIPPINTNFVIIAKKVTFYAHKRKNQTIIITKNSATFTKRYKATIIYQCR